MFKLKAIRTMTLQSQFISDVLIANLKWYDHIKAKLHKIHEVAQK